MSGISQSKFNDAHLKLFCSNFLNHYQALNYSDKQDIGTLFNKLYDPLIYSLKSPDGTFFDLDNEGKTKLLTAFKTMFYSLPEFQSKPDEAASAISSRPQVKISELKIVNHYYHRSDNDSWVLWALLATRPSPTCSHGLGTGALVHGHHSKNENKKDSSLSEILAGLLLLALALAALAAFVIAMYFLVKMAMDGFERMFHNEGWLRAVINMSSALFFGTITATMSALLLAMPIASLAVVAGFSPLFFVALAVTTLSLVGAAVSMYLTDWAVQSYISDKNNNAIDPDEPERYGLTKEEERWLVKKGIDPIAVKCAIIALRTEMSARKTSDQIQSSFLHRCFGYDPEIQELLTKVRQLKKGTISEVELNGLKLITRYNDIHKIPVPDIFESTRECNIGLGY